MPKIKEMSKEHAIVERLRLQTIRLRGLGSYDAMLNNEFRRAGSEAALLTKRAAIVSSTLGLLSNCPEDSAVIALVVPDIVRLAHDRDAHRSTQETLQALRSTVGALGMDVSVDSNIAQVLGQLGSRRDVARIGEKNEVVFLD